MPHRRVCETIWPKVRPSFCWIYCPHLGIEQVQSAVRWPRGSRSLSSHLKSRLGLEGVKSGLLYELCSPQTLANPDALAQALKQLPIRLKNPRPVAEAISTAGGVALEGLTPNLMLSQRPGVYCAGRNAGLGSPHGRLFADGLFGQWQARWTVYFVGFVTISYKLCLPYDRVVR